MEKSKGKKEDAEKRREARKEGAGEGEPSRGGKVKWKKRGGGGEKGAGKRSRREKKWSREITRSALGKKINEFEKILSSFISGGRDL